jgi:hypothetical protein
VTDALQVHVARIIGTAEQAATDLQREVELEAGRRAAAIRATAQDDADRIRAEAEAQAQAYLEEMRVRIEAFAGARVDRITALTDALLAMGEAIQARMADAVDLQAELGELLTALTGAARAAAAESASPVVRLPRVGEDRPRDTSEFDRPAAPTAAGAPVVDVDAGAHVQRIAQDLPRASRPTSPSEDQSA